MNINFIDERARIADIFNSIMKNYELEIEASKQQFSIGGDDPQGNKLIYFTFNQEDELADLFFNCIWERASSGSYYHYVPFDTFEEILKNRSLRFYSTKKSTSQDEFIPLCKELNLDGYYRVDENTCEILGEYAQLMDRFIL